MVAIAVGVCVTNAWSLSGCLTFKKLFCELKYLFVVFCRRKGKKENGTRKGKIGKEEINATIQGKE